MILTQRILTACKWGWIGGCLLVIAACGDEQHNALQNSFDDLKQSQTEQLAQLDKRLQALEQNDELEFVIYSLNHSINDQLFQPLLTSQARLRIEGDQVPETLYLDVALEVKSEKDNISLAARQVFPVVNGRSKLEFRQPLPAHGLKVENLEITLKPLNWYQGEVIAEKQIQYQ